MQLRSHCHDVEQLGNKDISLARRYMDKFWEHPHNRTTKLIDDFGREAHAILLPTTYNAKEMAVNMVNGYHKNDS